MVEGATKSKLAAVIKDKKDDERANDQSVRSSRKGVISGGAVKMGGNEQIVIQGHMNWIHSGAVMPDGTPQVSAALHPVRSAYNMRM